MLRCATEEEEEAEAVEAAKCAGEQPGDPPAEEDDEAMDGWRHGCND